MYLVISTSLTTGSLSRQVAVRAAERLEVLNVSVGVLHLSNYVLPMHDGSDAASADVASIRTRIGSAAGIILVIPIYFGDIAVSARNFLQLVGDAWRRKVVGIACIAGDRVNHSACLNLANWLMLEHRTFVLPDFVFTERGVVAESLGNDRSKLNLQIGKLAENLKRVTESLRTA